MSLYDLRKAVVSAVTEAVPDDVRVEAHPGRFSLAELERVAAGAPAIRIALLNVATEHLGGGQGILATAQMAAYVITRSDRAQRADERSLLLASLLLPLVDMNQWGIACQPAADVAAANLFSNQLAKRFDAHLAAVTWSQAIQLGATPDSGTPITDVWLGYEPEVFPDDYDHILHAEADQTRVDNG